MDNDNRFFKVYANLPLNLRDEVVLVIDGESMTWRVVNIEISSETLMGKQVLNKLIELKII